MALSPKALQKKREKKKQARQSKVSKSNIATQPNHMAYSRWSLYECWATLELWETIIVTRKNHLGDIAVGMYLIDIFCLGIKDFLIRLTTPLGYEEMLEEAATFTGELESVEPSYASTLIHKAKDYAFQLGFKPHPDFIKAQLMLKGIPLDESQVFNFGKESKPLYIQGPNETRSDVKRIM